MSIFSDYQVYVPSLERYVTIATHESFIGRVVNQFSKVERIMSDVWDTVYYATVLTENDELQDVRLGCSEFPRDHATVDASDFLLARADARRKQIYEERQARERAAIEARNAQIARAREAERIRRESLPKNGDVVTIRVDRRCRNPGLLRNNGKTGRIFWLRNERYGVALSDDRDARGFFTNVVWARASQLVVDDGYC